MEDVIELSSGSDEEDISDKFANWKQFQEIWKIAVSTIPKELTNASQHAFPYKHIKTTLNDVVQKVSLIADRRLKEFIFMKLIQLFQAFKLAYHGIGEGEKINFLLIDFVALYINFKCNQYYTADQLKLVINTILTELHVLFSGQTHFIIMAMLKVNSNPVCCRVVYPILIKYISDRKLHNTSNLLCYIRLILLTRKWNFIANSMENENVTTVRTLKHEVEKYLPTKVPPADELNRPFVRISDLIGFAIRRGHIGTRILLENDALNINETIGRFFQQYELLLNKGDTMHFKQSDLCLNNNNKTHSDLFKDSKKYTRFERLKRSCSKQLQFGTENNKMPEISSFSTSYQYTKIKKNTSSVDMSRMIDKQPLKNDLKEQMNKTDMARGAAIHHKVKNNSKNYLPQGEMQIYPENDRPAPGFNTDDKKFNSEIKTGLASDFQKEIGLKVDIMKGNLPCLIRGVTDLNSDPSDCDRFDHEEFKSDSSKLNQINFYLYDKNTFSQNVIESKYICMQSEISNNDLNAANQSIILLPPSRNRKKTANVSQSNIFPAHPNCFFPGKINISKLSPLNLNIRENNLRHYTYKLAYTGMRKLKFANMFSAFIFPIKILQLSNICLQSGSIFLKKTKVFDNQNVNTNNLEKIWMMNEMSNFSVAIEREIESNDSSKKSNEKCSLNTDQIKSKTIMSILRHNFKKPSINKSRLRDSQPLLSEIRQTTILRKIPQAKSSQMKFLFSDISNKNGLKITNFLVNKQISTDYREGITTQAEIDKARENEVSSTSNVKRKCESKNSYSESIDRKRKKTSSEGNSRQKNFEFQHSWHNEEKLLKECLSNLNLKKLDKETNVLLKFLTSLTKSPTLEAYFIINKIIVTFIYECLLSLDYSRITLRKYLSICSKAKKLQSKNVDNANLYEIEVKYQELKANIHNPNIIHNLDLVLNTLRTVKKNVFNDEWQHKNKHKIQKYVYMDPIESSFNVDAGCVHNDEVIEKKTEVLKDTIPNRSTLIYEQNNMDSIASNNFHKHKPQSVVTSRARNKFEDGLHCTDVNLCDFTGEYDSTLGSSNLDFMPDEIKLDGPIIPFPQNSGNFNDILEHSLNEADISPLNDSDTTDHFFSNQNLDSNILVDTEIFCTKNIGGEKSNLTCNHDPVKSSYTDIENENSNETNLSDKAVVNPYMIPNDRNLLKNSFWNNLMKGPCDETLSLE